MAVSCDREDNGTDTRTRIAQATLTVILEHGVRGATYRRVAAQAQLSPGTLTYRYKSIDALLIDAFIVMIDEISHAFHQRLAQAEDIDDACEAVADLICGNIWATPNHLTLSFELYALASRQEAYRALLQEWMSRSRAALHRHFSEETSWTLDVLIEGYTIHNFFNRHPMSREKILQAIARLVRE
ncbi:MULTISPECIES: TetR/AcrR family transcriptional regulator [unclassified Symbiopectobacterium]|uniref:TetR/AcrR family transcriptional regulator n=1 Tax=unclassified Symbiopectobacterium TaxID=2794573 RepID=UPI0022276A10|nr:MULTISPECIES: TetR family transcriptional regulator [unclassified Symbiopectobacterium]MCW2474169.1 TetR family transcriptional regulator [Candidatus Symbiopectobacterium sp. NZEC151]MCW2485407.1 TetR family transcriptional regulator [Candidatus Symbiopectobacterium sp. NZEC127]